MPGLIYLLAAGVVVHLLLMVGLVDLELIRSAQPSISQFLRDNPMAFWIPVALCFLFIVGLWVHLWAR